jgi:hypothetical protein
MIKEFMLILSEYIYSQYYRCIKEKILIICSILTHIYIPIEDVCMW